MAFLAPWALAALLLAAVPILLHLLRRDPPDERLFPALRHFPRDRKKRERELRLRERLILFLRVAAVVVAVLGAARWLLPVGSAEHPPADVVIVVDDGILAGAVVDGRRILDAEIDLARAILDRLGPLDRIWVLPASGSDRPVFPVGTTEARLRLGMIEPIERPAPVEDAVRRARALLDARAPAPKQIIVIRADGARINDEQGGPPFVEIDPGIEAPENRGIEWVEIGGGLPPRVGDPVEIRLRVASSGVGVRDEAVRLLLDGEVAAATRTDANGEALLALPTREEGLVSGWIEIDPDALRADDRHPIQIPVLRPARLRVLGELSHWLEAAISTLSNAGRILPPGTGDGSDGEGEVVLVVPPADPAGLARLNLDLESSGIPLRFGVPDEAGSFTLLRPGATLPPALDGVEMRRSYSVEGLSGDGASETVLAKLSDERPWAIEILLDDDGAESTGGRRILRAIASPIDLAWTELPRSAAFLPLLDRLGHPGVIGEAVVAATCPPVSPTPIPPLGGADIAEIADVLLLDRRGSEATPFLAWLLFVILCTEGWLAARTRGGARSRRERHTSERHRST